MVLRLTILIFAVTTCPALMAEKKVESEERGDSPARSESVRPASRTPVAVADLELVERVFQQKKRRPMDFHQGEALSDLDTAWQSYWWSGEDALFNTKGLVITGQSDWGPNWKPYGLIGLEEQVTFESYGKRRNAHLGIGVRYAFTAQVGSFLEFRAQSSSAIPQEALVRIGMHFSY